MIPSQIAPDTYPHIKTLCSRTLDLHIMDLRSMLQLPLKIQREPDSLLLEIEGGCNFASCTLILDVISGLSVCLYFRENKIGLNTNRDRGPRFKEFIEHYYPWQYESLDKKDVSKALWKFLRNPLVHTLGVLPLAAASRTVERVQINKSPLEMQEILDLEDSRSYRLSSTFELVNSTFHVNIPPLYSGLHQLFRNLFSDDNQMRLVETWYENQVAKSP